MANKGNTTVIVIVSVLLVGVAGYFIYRGVKSSSDLKKKLGEKKPDGKETETTTTTDATSTTVTQDLPVSNVPVGGGQSITSVIAKTQTILRKTPSATGIAIKKHVKPTKYDVLQEVKSGIFTFYKVTDGTTEGFIRSDQVII